MRCVEGLVPVALAAGAAMPLCAQAAPVVLENGSTRLEVFGGEANNGLVPSGGFFRYDDKGKNEETTWSIDPVFIDASGNVSVLSKGLFGTPTLVGGKAVSSYSSGGVRIFATTELVGRDAFTTFSIESDASLSGSKFLFYAENDIFGASDSATYFGSIAGGDLELFQYDSSTPEASNLSVRVAGEAGEGATLEAFGAGDWSAWGAGLEAGDLSGLSADGSNFETLGDLGLALLWALDGDAASIRVSYSAHDGGPEPTPPPPGNVVPTPVALPAGLAVLAIAATRRRARD